MAPDLSIGAIASWIAKLPKDVRLVVDVVGELSSVGSGQLIAALSSSNPAAAPDLLRRHIEDVREFGRARRVVLLAWLAAGDIASGRPANDARAALLRLIRKADAEEAEGAEGVGDIFLEDMREMMAAFGPRIARGLLSEPAVQVTMQSTIEMEGDLTLRNGGMLR